jgi:hypothetical protein
MCISLQMWAIGISVLVIFIIIIIGELPPSPIHEAG